MLYVEPFAPLLHKTLMEQDAAAREKRPKARAIRPANPDSVIAMTFGRDLSPSRATGAHAQPNTLRAGPRDGST